MTLADVWRERFLETRRQYVGALADAGYDDATIADVLDMHDVAQVTLLRMTIQERRTT